MGVSIQMFNIKRWFWGEITLKIVGWGSDRLLNLCKINNINIFNLNSIEDGYIFTLSMKDYKKIIYFNKKINTKIAVINKSGLPNFFYKYKKRKIFALCVLLCIISILIFSNYIWKISIKGNNLYTQEEIIKIINDDYIPIGYKKSKINCNQLEKELRERFNNIAWISCEIKGTNLIVHINESVPNNTDIAFSKPCNIVAYKDALITEIITNKGIKVVSKGDQVKKNDILITGIVNISNEYDELIETSYTTAQGTVTGIVDYTYSDSFPMENTKKVYTGKTKKAIELNIINSNIKLPSNNPLKLYDTISTTNTLELLENLYFPIGFTINNYKEYELKNVIYTSDEAYDIANKRLLSYIENLKKKGVSILENNVKITIVNDKCIATGIIKCKEVIGIPCEIEITQEGE